MSVKSKIVSIAAYNEDFERLFENVTRARYLKYFNGSKPNFKERESVGILLGAILSYGFGCILIPYLLRKDYTFDSLNLTPFIVIMAITGTVLSIWGIHRFLQEQRKIYKNVPDEEYDKFFEYDMKGALTRSRLLTTDKTSTLKDGIDTLEGIEPLVLYGPEDYSSNVNLPLLLKCGDDGIIRASNLFVLIIYPGGKNLYLHTFHLNLCEGSGKFDHIYECPYEHIEKTEYKKRETTMISQQQRKELLKRIKSFIITSGHGDTSEVSVDIIDYDIMEQYGGKFDETSVKHVMSFLPDFIAEKKKSISLAGPQLPSEE